MQKLIEVARTHQFDGVIMLNPYPLRNNRPDNLPENADDTLVANNHSIIVKSFERFRGSIALAAWGDKIHIRGYLIQSVKEIIEESMKYDIQWKHLYYLSRAGNPYTFSYLQREYNKKKENVYEMSDLDINAYLKQLV